MCWSSHQCYRSRRGGILAPNLRTRVGRLDIHRIDQEVETSDDSAYECLCALFAHSLRFCSDILSLFSLLFFGQLSSFVPMLYLCLGFVACGCRSTLLPPKQRGWVLRSWSLHKAKTSRNWDLSVCAIQHLQKLWLQLLFHVLLFPIHSHEWIWSLPIDWLPFHLLSRFDLLSVLPQFLGLLLTKCLAMKRSWFLLVVFWCPRSRLLPKWSLVLSILVLQDLEEQLAPLWRLS